MTTSSLIPSEWQFELAEHHSKAVILIRFSYNPDYNRLVRSLPNVRWSRTHNASWYVPDMPLYRKRFGLPTLPVGKDVLSQVHPVNQSALLWLIEILQLKAYSPSTITTY